MNININGQIATFASVFMRVPPLFIMDEILKVSFGLVPMSTDNRYSTYNRDEATDEAHIIGLPTTQFADYIGAGAAAAAEQFHLNQQEDDADMGDVGADSPAKHYLNSSLLLADDEQHSSFLNASMFHLFSKLGFLTLAYLCSNVVLLLSWSHLVWFYSVVGSLACVVGSYQSNVAAVHYFTTTATHQPPLLHTLLSLNGTALVHNSAPVLALGVNYVMQALFYLLFIYMQANFEGTYSWVKGVVIWSFLLPSCSVLMTLSKDVTLTVSMLCALVPLLLTQWRLFKGIPYACLVIINGLKYAKNTLCNFGVHALLEMEWGRLNIPNVLRLFWLIRVSNFVALSIANHLYEHDTHNIVTLLDTNILYGIFKSTMTCGCETVLALLGMTSVVSYISHYIGVLFQMLLLTEDDDRGMGTVSAILFFVLAEQNGLTVLENEKRYIRLCRNFCLLFTAMLHFIHNMVNPVLMSLSASRNPSMYRHMRAVSVCAILIILPIILLYCVWSMFSLSTWLFALSAFSVQVVIKTLVTVLIYGIFLADAYYSLFWDKLDDYVYYIKAVGNTIEFIFGIVLFFNGLWIYCFESGGTIRALMMCVHAYVNIWCEAINGWSSFMKRRNAVKKIDSIPNATKQQLDTHDDVCAICYQDLTEAKITKCKHLFHDGCLRKWLYVQDSCPLCHETIYNEDGTASAEETPDRVGVDLAVLDDLVAEVVDALEVPRRNDGFPRINLE